MPSRDPNADDDDDNSHSYLAMYRPNRAASSLQARAQNIREMRNNSGGGGAARPSPRPSQRNQSPSPPPTNRRRTSNSTVGVRQQNNNNKGSNGGNRRTSASIAMPPPLQGHEEEVVQVPAAPPAAMAMSKNAPRTVYYYLCEHTETVVGEGKCGPSPTKMLKKRPCDACLAMRQERMERKQAVKKNIGRGRNGQLGIVREKR